MPDCAVLGRISEDRLAAAKSGSCPPCVHCKERPADRRRGLCWRCHRDKGIREQHPRDDKFQPKHKVRNKRRMPCPTAALPGSEDKVATLEWRYANGFHLHHPRDARPDLA